MNDIVCISPIDGAEVARRPLATSAEIDAALAGARQAQRHWAAAPLAERKVVMAAFLDAMLAQNQDIDS